MAPKTMCGPDQVIDPANLLEAAGAQKEVGNASVQARRFAEAVTHYEKAVETLDRCEGQPMLREDVEQVVRLKATLYSNLTLCLLKQELFRQALDAANTCLSLDEANHKARFRRAQARDPLKLYAEALEDLAVLEALPAGEANAPKTEELAKLREGIEGRKARHEARLAEEADSSDDETVELVHIKRRFDDVVDKYNLKDEETASEIADWLTRNAQGDHSNVTLADLERRWGMDEDDGYAFLAWIDQGQKFKKEQAEVSKNFTGGA